MERSKTTLYIRHLPKELSNQEKIDLLCHFGAESVCPMSVKGPMKHSAFAKFTTEEQAERGLKRLHQLEVLGHNLVVEFAKNDYENEFPTGTKDEKGSIEKDDDEGKKMEKKPDKPKEEDPFLSKHNIPYPKKPTLFYSYPPPTVSTLTNIANALASHPRFYTQVLHLMNKMNLPCPFGAVTASPPLALDSHKSQNNDRSEIVGEIEEVEMEEEESEIESDGDDILSKENLVSLKRKRPQKKMRLVKPDMSLVMKPVHIPKTSEVFENVESKKSSQIVFNITESNQKTEKEIPRASAEKISDMKVIEGGFGKVEPVSKPEIQTEMQKPDVNYVLDHKNYWQVGKVMGGRLKPDQMKEFSVFKNYSRGEPTCRLYIKNLTKQTTEQDLVNLFGNFIDWTNENAAGSFDVRLMKEGRMKGQCFVTLPDESSAIRIIDGCNGFVMNSKPIVIQFARSARAKDVDKPLE